MCHWSQIVFEFTTCHLKDRCSQFCWNEDFLFICDRWLLSLWELRNHFPKRQGDGDISDSCFELSEPFCFTCTCCLSDNMKMNEGLTREETDNSLKKWCRLWIGIICDNNNSWGGHYEAEHKFTTILRNSQESHRKMEHWVNHADRIFKWSNLLLGSCQFSVSISRCKCEFNDKKDNYCSSFYTSPWTEFKLSPRHQENS